MATPSLVRMRETCAPAVLALLGGITRFASAAPVAVTAAREVPPCGITCAPATASPCPEGFAEEGDSASEGSPGVPQSGDSYVLVGC